MIIVKVNKISKEYNKVKVLNEINMSIKENRIIGIIGPNGAGKTTLIRIILGIIKPTSGNIEYNEIINKYTIGYLPTNRGLYEELTVIDNIILYSKIYRVITKNVDILIDKFNITDIKYEKIKNLSSGMQQKVSFICSIIHNPKLLILDEPTANLDIENKMDIIKYINDYKNKGTIIITSHNLTEIEKLCDEIYIINKGIIVESGMLNDIIKKYSINQIVIEAELNYNQLLNIKDKFNNIDVNNNKIIINKYNLEIKNNIIKYLAENNINITKIVDNNKNLEDVFLELIKYKDNNY